LLSGHDVKYLLMLFAPVTWGTTRLNEICLIDTGVKMTSPQ
jgi:hypothetical protein